MSDDLVLSANDWDRLGCVSQAQLTDPRVRWETGRETENLEKAFLVHERDTRMTALLLLAAHLPLQPISHAGGLHYTVG